jgi:hypothetical protein
MDGNSTTTGTSKASNLDARYPSQDIFAAINRIQERHFSLVTLVVQIVNHCSVLQLKKESYPEGDPHHCGPPQFYNTTLPVQEQVLPLSSRLEHLRLAEHPQSMTGFPQHQIAGQQFAYADDAPARRCTVPTESTRG